MKRGCKDCFTELLLKLMPEGQYKAMADVASHAGSVIEMRDRAHKTPNIGETDGMERHGLALHYFTSSCDWYICEWDREDEFFGYVILNNDLDCSEWGYINRRELLALEPVLAKRGDVLNLDFHCPHKTIEDALYARDNEYFAKYRRDK